MTAASVLSGGAMLVLCVGMFIASDVPVYFLLLYYLLGILVANAYVVMTYVSALKEYKEVTLSYFCRNLARGDCLFSGGGSMGNASGGGSIRSTYLRICALKWDADILVCECIWDSTGGLFWIFTLFCEVP